VEEIINVQNIDGKAVTTSLEVAKRFRKLHKNVIRDIECIRDRLLGRLKIEPSNAVDSKEFWEKNFEADHYLNRQSKKQPMYYLTRDAFMFLAMGFTGEEADQWKIQYLHAFNNMESLIRANIAGEDDRLLAWGQMRLIGKAARRTLTDVIKEYLIPAAISQGSQNSSKLYMSYTALLNKELVEDTGIEIKKPDTVRNYLDAADLLLFKRAEERLAKRIKDMVEKQIHYKEIYQECKQFVQRAVEVMGTAIPTLPRKTENVPKLEVPQMQLL
jgi:Rha family phage regulatory protein